MFTRDKNALRDLGTALETYSVGSGPERYRLIANTGPVIDLTLAEAAAVRLAANIWAAGDLSEDANKAAEKVTGAAFGLAATSGAATASGRTATASGRKINSSNRTPKPQTPSLEDLEALSAANDAALIAHVPAAGYLIKPLLAAISECRRVRFGYRSGVTGKVNQRLVEPWRVAFRDGGWYLLGLDVGQPMPDSPGGDLGLSATLRLPDNLRQPATLRLPDSAVERPAERAFRLSRVVGEIKAVSAPGSFPQPREIDVSDLLGETSHTISATLALMPSRGARLRALATPVTDPKWLEAAPAGFEVMAYRYDDEREFADELASLGPNVVVLGPPQLKAAVVSRLKAAAGMCDLAGQVGNNGIGGQNGQN
jgi:proteasome accessory factor B